MNTTQFMSLRADGYVYALQHPFPDRRCSGFVDLSQAIDVRFASVIDTGDTMMLSLYFTLGVFLLVAAREPCAHRSLIAFTAWSSFAHAAAMTILGFHMPSERVGFLSGSAVLVVIGAALLSLALAKQPVEQASAAGA